MKTLLLTFRKPGHEMTATLKYRFSDRLESRQFTGDTEVFLLKDGRKISPFGSLSRIREIAEFQARQAGATVEIQDLGGEALEWTDSVEI